MHLRRICLAAVLLLTLTAAAATTKSEEARAKCGETGALAEAAATCSQVRRHFAEHTRRFFKTGYWFEDGRPRGAPDARAVGRARCGCYV